MGRDQTEIVNRARNLERDLVSLRQQEAFYRAQAEEFEGKIASLNQALKDAHKRHDDINTKYLGLLNGGESSKYPHINHIRSQSNQTFSQLEEAKKEVIVNKKQVEKLQGKVNESLQ